MARRDTKTHGMLVAEEKNNDPGFREEWERTALARLVASKLVGYRADHGLTQGQLAGQLGKKQPFVAKLEAGDRNPEVETLVTLSRALGIEFMIDIAPATRKPKLVTKRIAEEHQALERDGVSVVVAAAS